MEDVHAGAGERHPGGVDWHWIMAGLLAAAVVAGVVVAPVRVRLRWATDGRRHRLAVQVWAPLGLWHGRWRMRRHGGRAGRRPSRGAGSWLPRLRRLVAGHDHPASPQARRARALAERIGRYVVIERWRLDFTVGAGDPALTACACGMAYAVLGAATAAALSWVGPGSSPPRLDVRPDYRPPRLQARGDCIARIRLGHLISAAVGTLWAAR